MADNGGSKKRQIVKPPTIQRDGFGAWAKWRLLGPGRWPFTLFDLLGGSIAVVGFFDACATASALFHQSGLEAFRSYLWGSYSIQVCLIAATLVIFKKVHTDLREAQVQREDAEGQIAIREAAIVLQHQMSEEVRKCALKSNGFDPHRDLQRVLGSQLRDYMRRRLGEGDYSVTVKQIESGEGESSARLHCVFRDTSQKEIRACGNDLPPEESHVYTSFIAPTSAPSRLVVVRDIQQLAANDHSFKQRAEKCGFRSIVAFPLRRPDVVALGEGMATAQLIGFLSIDSGQPNRFDGLFVAPDDGMERRNDGTDVQALPDVEVFYGLADSIATIVVLCRAGGKQQGGE